MLFYSIIYGLNGACSEMSGSIPPHRLCPTHTPAVPWAGGVLLCLCLGNSCGTLTHFLNITPWEGPFLLPEARLGPQTSSLLLMVNNTLVCVNAVSRWPRPPAFRVYEGKGRMPCLWDYEGPAQFWPLGFPSIRKRELHFMPCPLLQPLWSHRREPAWPQGASLLPPDGDTEAPLSWWCWETPGIYQPSSSFFLFKFMFLYLVLVAAWERSVAAHGI